MFRIIIMLFLFSVSTLYAQTKQQRAVEAAVEQLRIAMVDGDAKQLEALVSDKLSYGHSSGQIENKQQFIEKLRSGKSDFVRIELSAQQVILAGKTALVRHQLQADTMDGGKPGTVQLNVLLVWKKEKGTWKLLARQSVKKM